MKTYYILIYLILILSSFSCTRGSLSPNDLEAAQSLFRYGKKMQEEGKADSAVIYYRKSLSILEHSNQYELIASIYNQLGELLWLHNYYDRAISVYEEALKATEQMPDKTLTSKSLRGIGKCYILKNQFDSALHQIEKAYQLIPFIKERNEKACIYNNLSVIYSEQGEVEKAMEWNIKSMKYAEDSVLKFRNYASHSDLCYKTGEYDSARQYAYLGLQSKDIYIRASCIETLYLVAIHTNDPDSLIYQQKALLLSDSIKNGNKAVEIGDAELKLKQQQIIEAMNQQPNHWLYWLLGSILFINAILFIYFYFRHKSKEKAEIPVISQPQEESQQVLIKKGELYAELFTESLAYQNTTHQLSNKKHLTYNEQTALMEAISNIFSPFIDDLMEYCSLTKEESLLCCLFLLKLTNQQCAACKNVSENAIRTQKSRIKNKMTQCKPYENLFDVIFTRK